MITMPREPKEINPNSLKNLEKRGRKSKKDEWGEEGVPYSTNITKTAKDKLLAIVQSRGYKTVPDFLEHVAREMIEIPERPKEQG